MANRYWIGGTGAASDPAHWSAASGGAGGASVPTSADAAIFDANSGGGTATFSAQSCASLTLTGFTGTLTGSVNCYGNATGYTSATVSGLALTLFPPNANTAVVTSAGRTWGSIAMGASPSNAGTFSLGDALFCGQLTLNAGTFVTNNFAVTCTQFSSSNSNTRTLTLGSSSITVTAGGANTWSCANTIGLTVTASTATITFTGAGANWTAGNTAISWPSVVFSGSGTVVYTPSVTQTFANFTRTGTAVKGDALQLAANMTVTGTFTANGNSAVNRLIVQSNTSGTARTITAAAVAGSSVDFQDITGAGAGSWDLSALTGGSGDAGGNSGITFTTSVTRYGVVAGNWSSTATWSTASGGASGASVPLPQDDVVLDANSGAGTYVTDMPRAGRNLTATGFTRTVQWNANATFYGSISLTSAMTVGSLTGIFLAGRGSHTFTSGGRTLGNAWTFTAPGGTYTLADAFSTTSSVTLTNGTLDTNSMSVTSSIFSTSGSSATRSLLLGTTTWTLTSTSAAWGSISTGWTLDAVNSTIVIASASASSRTFTGGGKAYGTLRYTVAGSTGALVIASSNSFRALQVGSGRMLTLPSATNTAVTTWDVNGAAGNLTTVNASTPGSAATLTRSSGVIMSSDYVSVTDIAAVPAQGVWYAGDHSVDGGGNSGITFTKEPNRGWGVPVTL